MSEMDDNSLRILFRKAGHHAPGTDLTARIMAQVAVTPIAHTVVVKPLIGIWGWTILAAGTTALFALALLAPPAATLAPYRFGRFIEMFNGLRLPHGDWPVWTIGASACALLFMLLDRVLERRTARKSIPHNP